MHALMEALEEWACVDWLSLGLLHTSNSAGYNAHTEPLFKLYN